VQAGRLVVCARVDIAPMVLRVVADVLLGLIGTLNVSSVIVKYDVVLDLLESFVATFRRIQIL
jgi:hypothetical protein